MKYCQIDSCDHNSVRLNLEVVGLCVADVVIVVALAVTETDNAEMVVRKGQDCLHLNLH